MALSGDGMVGVLADALRDVPGAVLGVLPGGRGNDLARVLGIPDDPVAACAMIADGVTRELVDLGLVAGERPQAPDRRSWASPQLGFDSDANRIANEAPAWLGGLVYAYGALRALLAWRRRASRSSSTRRASATLHRLHASAPPTRRPTAAACARRRTRCSTTACSR